MFSASLELVLTVAYREAVSRRHAYLTLEHLLYALAHDIDGERILHVGLGTGHEGRLLTRSGCASPQALRGWRQRLGEHRPDPCDILT